MNKVNSIHREIPARRTVEPAQRRDILLTIYRYHYVMTTRPFEHEPEHVLQFDLIAGAVHVEA